jgi:hypothetical protein
MGQERNAKNSLVLNPQGKRTVKRPGHKREDNIKRDISNRCHEEMDVSGAVYGLMAS